MFFNLSSFHRLGLRNFFQCFEFIGAPGIATNKKLLGAPGLTSRSKKLLGTKGIATSTFFLQESNLVRPKATLLALLRRLRRFTKGDLGPSLGNFRQSFVSFQYVIRFAFDSVKPRLGERSAQPKIGASVGSTAPHRLHLNNFTSSISQQRFRLILRRVAWCLPG